MIPAPITMTSHAGMGHLVCMDDDPAELALSAWSLARWRAITPRMPICCGVCSSLWT
jgi:hypothetical protein